MEVEKISKALIKAMNKYFKSDDFVLIITLMLSAILIIIANILVNFL